MKSIPKKLLIHTVKHIREKETDRWGCSNIEYENELRFVRIEPSKQIARDKNNAEIQLSATLFFDCHNSKPTSVEFRVDDKVLFKGEAYRIKIIEPLHDEDKLHHYELGLIKDA